MKLNESLTRRGARPLAAGIVVLIVIVTLLTSGGLVVRGYIRGAFAAAEKLRAARLLTSRVLEEQLDAETGIRGYAATGDPSFLEPFTGTQAQLDTTLRQLTASLQKNDMRAEIQEASAASAASREWFLEVAAPILSAHGKTAAPIQLRGKALIDTFRDDMNRIDLALDEREQGVGERTARAIDNMNVFIVASVGITLTIAILLLALGARSSVRAERERLRADKEEREIAALRAAYAAEKRIADTLQDAFVQRPLPTLPTLRFSATYVPATEETRVGGDWYDALELPGNRVLFAIGDVTGHGIEAAVTMNRTRQSLISSALFDSDPAAVLQRVNADLLGQAAPMVTAVAGYADAETYEFVYSTAGHPPPVLLEPGRPARLLECGSLPLGALPEAAYRTYRVQSVPGAMLVLYTDGAVEHSRDVLEGEQTLLAAATAALAQDPVESASFIHNAIFHERSVGDDVAILTIVFAADNAAGLTISADRATATFGVRINNVAQPAFPAGRSPGKIAA